MVLGYGDSFLVLILALPAPPAYREWLPARLKRAYARVQFGKGRMGSA